MGNYILNKRGNIEEIVKWALWILVLAAGSFGVYYSVKAIAGGVI